MALLKCFFASSGDNKLAAVGATAVNTRVVCSGGAGASPGSCACDCQMLAPLAGASDKLTGLRLCNGGAILGGGGGGRSLVPSWLVAADCKIVFETGLVLLSPLPSV